MDMTLDRRNILGIAVGGIAAGGATSAQAGSVAAQASDMTVFDAVGLEDASAALERALAAAAARGGAVRLAPGRITISQPVRLPSGARLVGWGGQSRIRCRGAGQLMGDGAIDVLLSDFAIEGQGSDLGSGQGKGERGEAARSGSAAAAALIGFNGCSDVRLCDLEISRAPRDAIRLWRSSGRVMRNRVRSCGNEAINAGDGRGLVIADNDIDEVANNGIVVWRETAGTDGSQVTNNRISRVRAAAGGSGQNGNGINAFRADHVLIANNTISDCAFSAVRCNSASNVQIVANNCRALGEVALYAEFAFEGAVIANNVVAGAATGIEVTNFNDGGRLACVQGNVIRDLVRREAEAVDKRGVGIAVEADTSVAGNTIEGAATAGIMIGWGRYLRQVSANANIIRDCAVGIGISRQGRAGGALVSANMIAGARLGHVCFLDHGEVVGEPAAAGEGDFGAARLTGNVFA